MQAVSLTPGPLPCYVPDRMDEFLAALPKAELHLHLEGTISPETLWAMAQANHVALPVGSFAELRSLYMFRSFDAFIGEVHRKAARMEESSDFGTDQPG